MPILYVSRPLRRRLRAYANSRMAHLLGDLEGSAPAGTEYRLVEKVTGVSAIFGLEVSTGVWPEGASPTAWLGSGRIRSTGPSLPVPDGLLDTLKQLQVESWQALLLHEARAYRFVPLGASCIISLVPPMRYVRGLDAEEADLARKVSELSSALIRVTSSWNG